MVYTCKGFLCLIVLDDDGVQHAGSFITLDSEEEVPKEGIAVKPPLHCFPLSLSA